MSFKLNYILDTKKGVKRDTNQDSSLIIHKDSYALFMIFDGVSSIKNSHIFIKNFKERVNSAAENFPNFHQNISEILFGINKSLVSSNISGMSTLAVLLFDKSSKKVQFINIGDSRIYVYTNQFLEKITEDDSLRGRENVITKCLGISTLSKNDFQMFGADITRNYLLCTDGFYKLMESNLKEYFQFLNFKNLSNIKRKINRCQKGLNSDDSTFILVRNEI